VEKLSECAAAAEHADFSDIQSEKIFLDSNRRINGAALPNFLHRIFYYDRGSREEQKNLVIR
jgi:hypothetical protein